MRVIVQRVQWARVTVDGKVVGQCGPGLLLLAGIHREDDHDDVKRAADRVAKMRIFNDQEGKMNLSLADLPDSGEAQILAISNFTVYGNPDASRRPSFIESASFEQGERLFRSFVEELKDAGLRVETGVFGAMMSVELCNDGPVTLIVETRSAVRKG